MNTKKLVPVVLSILATFTVVAYLVCDGYNDFVKVLADVRPKYLLWAMLASAGTYVFVGLSLWEVLRLLGYRIQLGAVISIAFVSTTINYVVSSMGVSGFALRAHLLRKRGVPFAQSVTTSVVISVLMYFILAVIIMMGTVLLLIKSGGSKHEMVEGVAGALMLLGICFGFAKAFFDHEFRYKWIRALWHGLNHIIYFFSGPLIPKESFISFETQLEEGILMIHSKKSKFTVAILCICGDWVFSILVLYMGFLAVGIKMPVGSLVAGFALGMVTTLIPVLPSGLGAMELTMSAIYANMGIDWNEAFVACLIFRVAYYVVPSFLSIFIYWGLKLSEPLDLAEEKEAELNIIKGAAK
ncbi:MAG: lysylphosphatidylglycerol synthase transmembrane domain-containing protein [Elusimicrobiaceae bacterium]|nr:lysylphosphatidylglycerol synthase transmembrane domain-containing protein [Elusimicrobiaceae bacterium]